MDFIIADKDMMELSYLKNHNKLDIDIGLKNNFELLIDRDVAQELGIDYGGYIFAPGTEWGGRFEYMQSNTRNSEMIWQGITFRKFLEQDFIIPPISTDYKVVTGDANEIMRSLFNENNASTSVFTVPEKRNVNFVEHRFSRYVSKHEGISDMLFSKQYRLRISSGQGAADQPFKIMCEAVPIVDHTELLEYSQDNKVYLTITNDQSGINHLITLGQGELKNRVVLHTLLLRDGSIMTYMDSRQGRAIKSYYIDQWILKEKIEAEAEERDPNAIDESEYHIDNHFAEIEAIPNRYKGREEKISIYDCSNVEGETLVDSVNNLKIEAEKKIREMISTQTLDMDVEEFDVEIGDIVAGRDRNTGITLSKPVTGMILRNQDSETTIEVSVEGGEE